MDTSYHLIKLPIHELSYTNSILVLSGIPESVVAAATVELAESAFISESAWTILPICIIPLLFPDIPLLFPEIRK